MPRICITGGGGYLGQCLAKALEADGHFIVLFDLRFSHFPNISLNSDRVLKVQGTILDQIAMKEALDGCEVCFHLAAYGMSGGASLEKVKNFQVNVEGTKLLIEECIKSNTVKRLLYTSSTVVIFDSARELQFADESVPYPEKFSSVYAESKCIAEQYVISVNCPSFQTCVLRLRGIYGPGEPRATQRTIDLVSKGYVRVRFSKTRVCSTQYLNVENAIHALIMAEKSLRQTNSPAAGKAYNIVDGGDPVDGWDFWFPLIRALGKPIPRLRIPFSFAYALAFLFEQLYRLFGIEPMFTRMEMLQVSVSNTYSIEAAKKDFGYDPKDSHELNKVLEFYAQQQKICASEETKENQKKKSRKHEKDF